MPTYVVYRGNIAGKLGMMEQCQYNRLNQQTVECTEERRQKAVEKGEDPEPPFVPREPEHIFEADCWNDAVEIFRKEYAE